MIVKSKIELFDELTKTVRAIHSYEVPEIISLPIHKGQKDYLSWIDNSVKIAKKKSMRISKKKGSK